MMFALHLPRSELRACLSEVIYALPQSEATNWDSDVWTPVLANLDAGDPVIMLPREEFDALRVALDRSTNEHAQHLFALLAIAMGEDDMKRILSTKGPAK